VVDTGAILTIDERTYLKQCGCEGSSSGPRVTFEVLSVTVGITKWGGGIQYITRYSEMVCDVCDRPWREQYNFWPVVRTEDGALRQGPDGEKV